MTRCGVLAMICLAGCGGNENANKENAIISSVTSAAGQVAEKVKEFDPDTYRENLLELKEAIEISDDVKAIESAQTLDAIIGNDIVSSLTRILIVRLRDGNEAAEAALEMYPASREFGKAARTRLLKFRSYLPSVEKEDVPGILAVIVYLALESRISHAAALPAAAVQGISAQILGVEIPKTFQSLPEVDSRGTDAPE